MTISVKLIADSISPEEKRLTTLELRYPKFIHGELMTHRVFSRNASSSRAVPVARLVSQNERVYPMEWGANVSGMQAKGVLDPAVAAEARAVWDAMAEYCAEGAQKLAALGLHKQWANRPLEWFTHINVVVSSTEWSNFFGLRCHPDAMPEMRILAEDMREIQEASIPVKLIPGQWHLPYIDDDIREKMFHREACRTENDKPHPDQITKALIPISVARCARVSYKTHEGTVPTLEEDLALYARLVGSQPIHASPAEHQATPDAFSWESGVGRPRNKQLWGNFNGWIQYRKTLPNENIK